VVIKRRKFTAKFKTKVTIAAIQEKHSLSELAQKYELHPQQIRNWKTEFLDGTERFFKKKSKNPKSEEEAKKDKLLQTIGALTVEND